MFVTLEVSKLSGWLNADALRNMSPMFVMLEVSKLSGWLNALATCRVERRAFDPEPRCEPRGAGA